LVLGKRNLKLPNLEFSIFGRPNPGLSMFGRPYLELLNLEFAGQLLNFQFFGKYLKLYSEKIPKTVMAMHSIV